MDIRTLVGKFAWTYRLPVEIADVIAALRDMGIKDEIRFFRDPELPKDVLQGYITRWYDETTKTFISNITYAAFEDPDMERFVCVKELMHIVDPEGSRVRSDAELADQISKIVLPLHLQNVLTDQLITDVSGEAYAIAVLMPFNARNMVKGSDLKKIAEKARVPVDYVEIAMSDRWHEIYKRLLPGDRR